VNEPIFVDRGTHYTILYDIPLRYPQSTHLIAQWSILSRGLGYEKSEDCRPVIRSASTDQGRLYLATVMDL
jgi:hypothetical protein